MLLELPSTSVWVPLEIQISEKSEQNSELHPLVALSEVVPGEVENAESSGGFRWRSIAFAGQVGSVMEVYASSRSSSVGSRLGSVAVSAESDASGDDSSIGQRFSWSFAPPARPCSVIMGAEAQRNAAVRLQTHWRGWLSRHAYFRLQNLARHMQRRFRRRQQCKAQETRDEPFSTVPLRRPPGSSEASATGREKAAPAGYLQASTASCGARALGIKHPKDEEKEEKEEEQAVQNQQDMAQNCIREAQLLAQKHRRRAFVQQQTNGFSRPSGSTAGHLHDMPLRKHRVFAAGCIPNSSPGKEEEEALGAVPPNLVESPVLSDLLGQGLVERVGHPEGYGATVFDGQMLVAMQSLSANLPRGARIGFLARVAATSNLAQPWSSGKGALASAAAYEAARQSLGPERLLWHGTSWESVPNIVRHGFNRAYAFNARHGSKLGRGVYFTEDAAYALRFAKQSRKSRALLLAGVLPGYMTRGQEGLIEPPLANAFGARFDSTADDPLRPRVICVFRDFQALPLYVVQVIT